MVSMDVVIKILDSGILAYVPIPGLEAVAQALVSTWSLVQAVSVSSILVSALSSSRAHQSTEQQAPDVEAHSAMCSNSFQRSTRSARSWREGLRFAETSPGSVV